MGKVVSTDEVTKHFRDGDSVLHSCFFQFGRPDTLLQALYDSGAKDLRMVSNDVSTPGEGTTLFVTEGRVSHVTVSYIGVSRDTNERLEELIKDGRLTLELCPQGTLVERIRAGGYGIGGFYTPAGAGTKAAEGKETKTIDGKEYVLEKPIQAKYGLVRAWKADRQGNLQFRGTERTFNSVIARAADIVIAEADIIQDEPLDPEEIHVPHNFVDYVVQSTHAPKGRMKAAALGDEVEELIARRVALEFKDNDVVNLGIGIPTLAANYLPEGVRIWLHSENGILGMGPRPESEEGIEGSVIDASGNYVTVKDYGAFFDSTDSFGLVRGGHLDVTVLGTLEVDQYGNLANWSFGTSRGPGMGGAMDLAAGAKRLIVATRHTSKKGPKIRKMCSLPLTAAGAVDLIVTDMAVLEVDHTSEGAPLVVRELAPGVTLEDLIAATEADLYTDNIREWRTE